MPMYLCITEHMCALTQNLYVLFIYKIDLRNTTVFVWDLLKNTLFPFKPPSRLVLGLLNMYSFYS